MKRLYGISLKHSVCEITVKRKKYLFLPREGILIFHMIFILIFLVQILYCNQQWKSDQEHSEKKNCFT